MKNTSTTSKYDGHLYTVSGLLRLTAMLVIAGAVIIGGTEFITHTAEYIYLTAK